ncbi:hypothetical protein [Methylogaea oryzae]|uniref:hypothetical protein n=1 Tax=Methylogaea oryzae TaxID=1295382 RepID=UPI0012E26CA9|nr:hypothetical protein [Methylogaea oryzae]
MSGGSWTAQLPLANLQNRQIARVARTTNAATASTQFVAALATSRLVRSVALVGHNLGTSAKYRIRGGQSPTDFSAPGVDTGWVDAWPRIYSYGSVPWGDPRFWGGRYTPGDLGSDTWHLIHVFPTNIAARYWLIELDDSANGAGYLQIGRLFIGEIFQPALNMAYGASIGYEPRTTVEESPSGAEFFNVLRGYRVAKFTLKWLDESEAMAGALDMQRLCGVHGEVLFVWDADDANHKLRRSFLGRMRQLSPIEVPYINNYSIGYEIKELLA